MRIINTLTKYITKAKLFMTSHRFKISLELLIKLKAKMKAIDSENEDFILSDTNLISIKGTPEYASSLSEDSPTNRIITSLYTKERLLFLFYALSQFGERMRRRKTLLIGKVQDREVLTFLR